MNQSITATQLAASRRQQLTAESTYHRPAAPPRPTGVRRHRRRPLSAFHTWLAGGQL